MTRPYNRTKNPDPDQYELEYAERPGTWIRFDDHTADYLEGFALSFFRMLTAKHGEEEAKRIYKEEWMELFDKHMDAERRARKEQTRSEALRVPESDLGRTITRKNWRELVPPQIVRDRQKETKNGVCVH